MTTTQLKMKCAQKQLGAASGYSGVRSEPASALVPSLIEPAKPNGQEPWAYFKEALRRTLTPTDRDLGPVLVLQLAIPRLSK